MDRVILTAATVGNVGIVGVSVVPLSVWMSLKKLGVPSQTRILRTSQHSRQEALSWCDRAAQLERHLQLTAPLTSRWCEIP